MHLNQKYRAMTQRLVLNAMLVAVYVVLGYLRIPIGNYFRISFAGFPVILCALIYGPIDGLIVGFVGEFLAQILGPYGLTQTTLLWCVGETVRGFTLGLAAWLLLRKWLLGADKLKDAQLAVVLAFCSVTGVFASLGQSLALYVDSKMFGYYSEFLVFGTMLYRILAYIVFSAVLGYLCLPIISALRKAKLIKGVTK